ncbi:unnamed protein product [Ixodes pacificus]
MESNTVNLILDVIVNTVMNSEYAENMLRRCLLANCFHPSPQTTGTHLTLAFWAPVSLHSRARLSAVALCRSGPGFKWLTQKGATVLFRKNCELVKGYQT